MLKSICETFKSYILISPSPVAKPQGIDPTRGIGTAYEGLLRIPKPGGVRKGWMKQFVSVCDFKIFLFGVLDHRGSQPTNEISHILDMRSAEFIYLHSFQEKCYFVI